MTLTLMGQIEKQFETISNHKPKTLAEAVSNELLKFMPRVSNKLFEASKKAQVALTAEQKNKIAENYLDDTIYAQREQTFDYVLRKNTKISAFAKIPLFAYSIIPREPNLVFPECAEVIASTNFQISTSKRNLLEYPDRDMVVGHFRKYSPYEIVEYDSMLKERVFPFPGKHKGITTLRIEAEWVSPFKLDVCVKVPQISESVKELGDKAISSYYQHASKVPKALRRTTSLISPRIGLLWIPIDESLFVKGKVSTPKTPPSIKSDSVLVLDIPDGEKSYRHIVQH